MVPGTVPGAGFNPKYTLYSVMVPALLAGGSQDKCAPSELWRPVVHKYITLFNSSHTVVSVHWYLPC